MKNLTDYIKNENNMNEGFQIGKTAAKPYPKREWLPRDEWIKQQRAKKKSSTCAFNNYEDVTQDMVDKFWAKPSYANNLVDIKDIRDDWKPAYETAKKNVAMLDYAMSPSYTVHFDKDANLKIQVNHGASWSSQNHLSHYAAKCRNYFTLGTAAYMQIDSDKYELLYDGKK